MLGQEVVLLTKFVMMQSFYKNHLALEIFSSQDAWVSHGVPIDFSYKYFKIKMSTVDP